MRTPMLPMLALFCAVALQAGCGGSQSSTTSTPVPAAPSGASGPTSLGGENLTPVKFGDWAQYSGDRRSISLSTTPTGAEFTTGCDLGVVTFKQPLMQNGDGQISATGIYNPPCTNQHTQAQLTGTVNGDQIDLTLNYTDVHGEAQSIQLRVVYYGTGRGIQRCGYMCAPGGGPTPSPSPSP